MFKKKMNEIEMNDAFGFTLCGLIGIAILNGIGYVLYSAFIKGDPTAALILILAASFSTIATLVYYFQRLYNKWFCSPTKKEKILFVKEIDDDEQTTNEG